MNVLSRGRLGRMLFSFITGFVIFGVSAVLDHGLRRSFTFPGVVLIDDLFMGFVCGALVLFYEERRHRALARKLTVIGEMNHIVRNELEIIEYSAYTTQNREHIERIRSCVGHLDWALREVLTEKKRARSETIPPREGAKRSLPARLK